MFILDQVDRVIFANLREEGGKKSVTVDSKKGVKG
jgi:hypothetical protein